MRMFGPSAFGALSTRYSCPPRAASPRPRHQIPTSPPAVAKDKGRVPHDRIRAVVYRERPCWELSCNHCFPPITERPSVAFIGLGRPGQQQVGAEPAIGDRLPSAEAFRCERPLRCIAFLRHVGCPFAEKTVRELRDLGASDARLQVFFVGHGDRGTTVKWLAEIGGAAAATWVDDPKRRLYGNCGLGFSRAAHFLGRASLTRALALRRDGIRNRSASGTRWQKAGTFLVDRGGRILWKHVPATADELPDPGQILLAAKESLAAAAR